MWGVVVGVGGVVGHGIWGSVTERKKNFLKIRNNISEQRKHTSLY